MRRFELSEHAPFGMVVIDKDGTYRYINPKFREMFGYDLNDVPNGKTWFSKAYPDPSYRHKVISAWVDDLEGPKPGEKRPRVFTVTCKDGSEKIINFITVQLETGENLMTCEDITERKQAEMAIKASEEKYRTLFESSIDAIMIWDKERNIISYNQGFVRLFGYSKSEIKGKSTRIIHPSDESFNSFRDLAFPSIEKFGFFRTEWNLIRKDGTPIMIETVVSAIRFPDRSISGFVSIIRDITERKQVEKALRESEDQLRLITEALPVLISYVDSEQCYRFNNKAYEKWFGHSRKEIYGKHIKEVLGDQTYHNIRRYVEAALSGHELTYESIFPHRDGGTRNVSVIYVPHFGEGGGIKGYFVLVSDITERRRAEEKLQKAHEMLEKRVEERTAELSKVNELLKQEITERKQMQEKLLISERLATLGLFSGSISHELKNPLSTIDSSVYYLKTKLKDADEKVRTHLDRIKSSVGSTLAVIDSLRNLTQIKEPRLERLDLVSITFDAIANSKVPGTVNVIRNITEQEVLVNADPEHLKMAFKNIVNNAIQAMDSKGTLEVTVRKINGQVEVSFTDTGPGIDPENLNKIFQPLFSTKAKGLGFGLSIAKMIIDKHGSTIEAKSEPGKGATILIRLPLYIQS